jgi:hypothetical protein
MTTTTTTTTTTVDVDPYAVDTAVRAWDMLRHAQERVERLTTALTAVVSRLDDDQRTEYVRRTTR